MSVRIAMWSGPRNISTAMMRSFENRSDTVVVDEPFYAAFLAETGANHPMRDEVLASQPTQWRDVANALSGPTPTGAAVWYQKHMTHHMLPDFGLDWANDCRNAFLIRAPEAVLASYTLKRENVTLADIGVERQRELFERECDRIGAAPPVIDSADVLADPRAILEKLCAAIGIEFSDRMLSWPAGKRESDGVWAPAWYDTVERSTEFGPPRAPAEIKNVGDNLRRIADAARPHYERLADFRLR